MQEQDKSIVAAEQAVRDNPTDAEAVVKLGIAYFYADRLDEALAAFQRALALDPDNATAYNGIGRVRYHTGPPEAAVEAYERAIALDPHFIAPVYGVGILYSTKLGAYDKALAAFRRGLVHNPEHPFLTANVGATYARMGRIDQALSTLEWVVERDPANAFAHSWLSLLYLHQQRYAEAIAACQREIAIEDAHSPHRLLGLIYDARGQTEAAIAEQEQALFLEAEDYEARAALAKLYRKVGRQREADEQLALANDLAQADHGEYGQACVAVMSGEVDRALALLNVALEKQLVQRGWVRIDPEFSFINDDPRFRALIDG